MRGGTRYSIILLILMILLAGCGGDGDDTTTTAEPAEATEAPDTTEAGAETTAAAADTTAAEADSTEAVDTTAAPEGDLPVVRLSALSGGLTAVALLIIEENGFDTANGFQGEYNYMDADASGQFFLQGNSDIAFDFDAAGAAIARTQGINVAVFYPILNNNNCIMVAEDSPYQEPADLIGETVGHFGADSGTTTSLSTVLSEYYDIDVFTDYTLVETGPPALVELLAQGEVAAIFDFVPHTSRAEVQVPARCLLGPIHDTLQEVPDNLENHLSAMAASDEWLAGNEETALAVMAAWDDAIEWLNEDPSRLVEEPYLTVLAQDDPAVLDLIVEQVTEIPLFTNDWSPEVQEGVENWIDLAAEQGILFDENPGDVVSVVGE
ncbi:MAG: hypothetical protein GEU79_11290 [Acidimicrobiia bacterium]|nr:hypothetical protein [Acidimicrobiia bacterium]